MRARILLPLSVFILSGLLAKAADCGVNFDRSVKTTVDAATEYKAKNPSGGYPRVVLVHKGTQLRIGPDGQSPPLCVAETEFFSVVLSSKTNVYGHKYFLVQGSERRGWVYYSSVADYGRANVEDLRAIASYSSAEIELPFVQTGVSTHAVKPGETLGAIANKYGLSADDLALLNNLTSSGATISEGQSLKVIVPTLPRASSLKDIKLGGCGGNPCVGENGSYYGEISTTTARPKTVYVRGYYRRDGTYVRSHYRSRPRR